MFERELGKRRKDGVNSKKESATKNENEDSEQEIADKPALHDVRIDKSPENPNNFHLRTPSHAEHNPTLPFIPTMRFIHQTRLASLSQKSPSFVRCTHSGHRAYSTLPPHPQKAPSPHAQWYTDILPAMVPIFLLGSAVSLVSVISFSIS